MSIKITPIDSSDQCEHQFEITPVYPHERNGFYIKDWRGGRARDDEPQRHRNGGNNPTLSDLTDCDTENATYISWEECSAYDYWPADYLILSKKMYYRYLNQLNSGNQNGPKYQNKHFQTYELNCRHIEALSSQLDLPYWQQKTAIRLFDALQRSNTGRPSHLVAFCVCAYVVHNNDDHRDCHPQMDQENRDPLFEEIREKSDIPSDQFSSAYNQLAYKIRVSDFNV